MHLRRALLYGLGLAAATALAGSGCATGVNTLEPDDEPTTAGTSGAGKGGSSGGGGSKTAGGGGSVSKAGSSSQAFGGAAATGGAGGKGGSAGAGGNANGGSAGAGGAAAGSGSGGSAGGAAGGGGSGGTGVPTGCLKDWKDNETCDTCTTQTQGDKLGCVDILDCYALNDCGPSTCANNDDKCGVNKIAKGTAGYEIAAEVHACICE